MSALSFLFVFSVLCDLCVNRPALLLCEPQRTLRLCVILSPPLSFPCQCTARKLSLRALSSPVNSPSHDGLPRSPVLLSPLETRPSRGRGSFVPHQSS